APKNFSCKFNSPAAAATSEGSEENPDCHYQKFEIKTNQTIGDIAENLKKAGLIRSDFAFKTYLKLSSKSAKIKAGTYSLRANLSAKEIVEQMEKGVASSEVFNLTVLPGETLKEIKQKLIKLGYLSEQIDTALLKKYDSPVLKGLYDNEGKLTNPAQPANVALEGYLYGETYQFYKGETVEHIFETMINQLNSVVVANHIEEKFQKRGFSLREGLILASIIQKEAHSEDMPGVSMVFQNRLKVGMTLGSDVTATYAADLVNPNRDRNDPNNNLRVLETDNLYNTRKHTGLTPGPICSPGITAILAVAEPDENKRSMRYFLTGDDGKMYYSVTDTEHTQKIRDYCQKLCSVGL
ncbi:endolytic transglycosylase MltG, partial [Candidatus Saccharibacteria bacterium]|nr:endolytic transglycosylase MltG [Candidatus Saccharibacteria bacterium]